MDINLQDLYADRRRTQKRIDDARDGRRQAQNSLGSSKKDKINLEKRLAEVEKIIRMLEGSGGMFDRNVPETIRASNDAAGKAAGSYRGCIRDDGVRASDVEAAFRSRAVDEDSRSSGALAAFRREETRLRRLITEIDTQIRKMTAAIDDYSKNIRRYENQMELINRQIRSF